MIEIDEPDRDMFAVFTKRHTVFAVKPCGKLFIGPHEAFTLDGEKNCPEFVDNLICVIRIFCDLRVDFPEGFNEVLFSEDISFVPWQIFSRDVCPAGFFHIIPDSITDSVSFVETHE